MFLNKSIATQRVEFLRIRAKRRKWLLRNSRTEKPSAKQISPPRWHIGIFKVWHERGGAEKRARVCAQHILHTYLRYLSQINISISVLFLTEGILA